MGGAGGGGDQAAVGGTKVVDIEHIVLGEYAANEVRKDFTPSERVSIAKAVAEEMQKKERRGRPADNSPENSGAAPLIKISGRTNELAAVKSGFGSGRNFERAQNVINKGAPVLVELIGIIFRKRWARRPHLIYPAKPGT